MRCELTGMAGRTRITSVCAVTGEGVPGLGTFTLVLTEAGQTPKGRQTQLRFPTFGHDKLCISTLICYSERQIMAVT